MIVLDTNVVSELMRRSPHYAEIVATRERVGRPISMADGQIAAICRNCNAGLATRNVDDFADTGIDAVNPWDAETVSSAMRHIPLAELSRGYVDVPALSGEDKTMRS